MHQGEKHKENIRKTPGKPTDSSEKHLESIFYKEPEIHQDAPRIQQEQISREMLEIF